MIVREACRIGSLAALRQNKRLSFAAAGREIAVFEVAGEIIASQGKCPHAGGPLCQGTLAGTILTCPWHGWSYDLKTGECEEDASLSLQLYEVRVEGDDLFVTL
jgi:nitrite reductase (NADH) small subunit